MSYRAALFQESIPHKAFGALKTTNLGEHISVNY